MHVEGMALKLELRVLLSYLLYDICPYIMVRVILVRIIIRCFVLDVPSDAEDSACKIVFLKNRICQVIYTVIPVIKCDHTCLLRKLLSAFMPFAVFIHGKSGESFIMKIFHLPVEIRLPDYKACFHIIICQIRVVGQDQMICED